MDKMLNEMEFQFNKERKAFNPNYSFEISILTKILDSTNETVKEIIKENKNFAVFDSILGQDINSVYNQKLLYNPEKDNIQMGINLDQEKEVPPLQYFCNKNIMDVLKEDNEIYSLYLQGGDYEKALSEKKEREKAEQEERRKLNEEGKKIIQDTEEEIGLNNQINENEGKNEEQEVNQNEKEGKEGKEGKEEEHVENENPSDVPEIESSSEETEDDKSFNDVNYWNVSYNVDEKKGNDIINALD